MAIYDTKTRNLSFLQTSKDLREGKYKVKNNKFFLILYDEELQGIDPFNYKILTPELVMRIQKECIINPWYFLREVARIPDQGSAKGIPYQLNRANLAATWCFVNSIDHYLCIPRQIGKTQSTVATLNWAFHFGTTFSEFMFLNIDETASKKNLSRLKDQRDLLPQYMQVKTFTNSAGENIKEGNSAKSFTNCITNNSVIVKGKASSIDTAETIGRGLTQPVQYFDEFEFCSYIKTIMEASGPAYGQASRNSERNNAPHCRIITSTPGDLDSQAGQDAAKVIEKTTAFMESFYDWDIRDVKEYITKNAENGIVYIEYQYQELGKDEDWFVQTCKYVNNDRLKIQREIFLKRMHGSENSPFEPSDLAAIGELQKEPIEEFIINKYFKVDVYTKLDRNRVYLIGVDVSTGIGKDNTAVTIFDPYTNKVVAEFSSPLIGITALVEFLINLIRFYLPKGVLIVERNHNGEAVLDLLRNSSVFGNVYFDYHKELVGEGIDDRLDNQGLLVREAARRQIYGVYTASKSREKMIGLLEEYVENNKESFVTKNITKDIFHLVRNRRGKIEAASGEHDDSIMSFLIVLYVYHYGNNLHYFGYYKGKAPDEKTANQGLYQDSGYALEDIAESDFSRELFKNIQNAKTMEDYSREMRQEIQRAHTQMSQYDHLFDNGVQARVTLIDDAGNSVGAGSDFFDYLND